MEAAIRMTTVTRAYDAIAQEYDAHLERDPVARYMRARLHEHFRRLFRPGDHVLDLTAGTGTDACYLAALGVQVTALDASPGMVAELKQTAARRGLQIEAQVLAAECLDELDARDMDGAISTFAGLNTMDDLPRLAQNLAERLKPHGRVLVHALNAFCLWRWVADRKGVRSRREGMWQVPIGGQIVPHRVYNPFALWRTAFAEQFDLRRAYALSVIAGLPLIKRFSFAAGPLFALDRIMGQMFPATGDFFVVELEKRDAQRRNTPCI
jgi:SAM-dependent methyltransferase